MRDATDETYEFKCVCGEIIIVTANIGSDEYSSYLMGIRVKHGEDELKEVEELK